MTQDDIIAMAKEAGCIPRRHPEYWEDIQVFATPDVLVKFVKLVAAHVSRELAKECAGSGEWTAVHIIERVEW